MAVQKRYKVKNMNTGAIEEVYAFNDAEVLESYKIVGHEVKILGTVELPGAIGGVDDPDPSHPNAQQMLPIPPGGIPQPQQQQQAAPQEIKFSTNGLDFKLTPDGVFVKNWVDLEDADYRILSQKTGKETRDYRVQVKDWVKTEDPPNDKTPNEPQVETEQIPQEESKPENTEVPGEAGERIVG